MPDWTPDPVVGRFIPDPELEARAQRHMMALESEACSPAMIHARQQWTAAVAGVRVAMESLRDIWPVDKAAIPSEAHGALAHALDLVTSAFDVLDDCQESFEGRVVRAVACGAIVSHAELDLLGVPR